ncbi:hypothetical protein IQ17_06091 [Bradyrhizobium daqingense]|uniref:Uncharacterized protein n=2 Tax=Bradyrhizobium daqingense TaxID=993502 RepID=A0A562KS04_9BRAD|nr:hypothetical protein IQ17_06091 [Bradyrhizobium daqingense]
MSVPSLDRRYYFHSTYKRLAKRNRTFGRIDIGEPNTTRAISLVAALKEFVTPLSHDERARLRSRILESLDPDRDIRELEHEMRAFVHYKSAGYTVTPGDGNKMDRFDFLIRGNNREFELECKTFAESIGTPVSVEDSVYVFRAIRKAVLAEPSFRESGILRLIFPARPLLSEQELEKIVAKFLLQAPTEQRDTRYSLRFERRPEWDAWLKEGKHSDVVDNIANQFAEHNLHFMTMLSRNHAVMGVVGSEQRSHPVTSIFSRLKKASDQFSKQRPAVLWGNFLGIGESEFRGLLAETRLGHRSLDVFGHNLFKSSNRNHIVRLRLSADGLNVQATRSESVYVRNEIHTGGPAYDLTSRVSRYSAESTE